MPTPKSLGNCCFCGYDIHIEAKGDNEGNVYHFGCKNEADQLSSRAQNAYKARGRRRASRLALTLEELDAYFNDGTRPR